MCLTLGLEAHKRGIYLWRKRCVLQEGHTPLFFSRGHPKGGNGEAVKKRFWDTNKRRNTGVKTS